MGSPEGAKKVPCGWSDSQQETTEDPEWPQAEDSLEYQVPVKNVDCEVWELTGKVSVTLYQKGKGPENNFLLGPSLLFIGIWIRWKNGSRILLLYLLYYI